MVGLGMVGLWGLANDVSFCRTHQESEKSSIEVRRRAAQKAKQDVAKLEPYKEQQDRLVER